MPGSRRLFPSLLVAAALFFSLASVSTAAATERHAAPDGTGAICTAVSPCSIETALAASVPGDTVYAAPGTYEDAGPLNVDHEVTLSGEAGKAKPLFETTAGGSWVFESTGAPTLRDLRVHGGELGIAVAGGLVERVESTGSHIACAMDAGRMRDSLCVATGFEGVGLEDTSTAGSTLKLFNDTAIGGDKGVAASTGISTVVVEARNTIASGGTDDLYAEPFLAAGRVELKFSHSNFSTHGQSGQGNATITLPSEEGNQSVEPVFTNPAAGDYTEQLSSPTRFAGDLAGLATGELDLAGNPRTTTCQKIEGIDIGAYQLTTCPPPTTLYAAPNGSAANVPCTAQSAPCDLVTAVKAENLREGDTLLLAPGTYHLSSTLRVVEPATFEGEPGEQAPLIESSSFGGGISFEGGRSTVRNVRLHMSAEPTSGLVVTGGESVVERVEVIGAADWACAMGEGTIRDSVCVSTRKGGGYGFDGASGGARDFKLINDTMVGTEEGMFFVASNEGTMHVEAVNTIASGGEYDIQAYPYPAEGGEPPSTLTIDLSHSNFSTVQDEEEFEPGEPGNGLKAQITSPTENGNQSAEPLFVAAAGGNFMEQPTSPTKFAGTTAVVGPGELDLADNPRTVTCSGTAFVDIGAYQLAECPPNGGGTSGGGSATPPPASTAPELTKLALKPAKFEKKTTISFTLSTAATVKLEVLTKKKKNGKTKTVKVGTLPQVSGKAGSDKVKFNGKLKGRHLAPGKYTLRATATATATASGLSSTSETKQFEVLP
ncbi:MAG TPA: hypothetical protein VMH33_10235 [Solirubrobacterales bacterium]|nr:hypothetical protein [Solirubrobacterales bacterium]